MMPAAPFASPNLYEAVPSMMAPVDAMKVPIHETVNRATARVRMMTCGLPDDDCPAMMAKLVSLEDLGRPTRENPDLTDATVHVRRSEDRSSFSI
jgi:hypothetical protein